MKPVVSPKDLARAIAVSESSIKRWVDEGTIAAVKTSGGHRRIAIEEVIRFTRLTQTPIVHPEILGLPAEAADTAKPTNEADDAERLQLHLQNGDAPKARGLLISMYLRGRSVASICDGPIHTAMAAIGEIWKHRNGDGIFIEHRASDICIQAVSRIRALFEPPALAPIAIGGAAPGDLHVLSTLATSIVLESEGFRAVNLGPDTPIHSFMTAVQVHQPLFVWVSISMVHSARSLSSQLGKLAADLQQLGVRLAMGGTAVDQIKPTADSDVFVGTTMIELIAFAKGLALSRGDIEVVQNPPSTT